MRGREGEGEKKERIKRKGGRGKLKRKGERIGLPLPASR